MDARQCMAGIRPQVLCPCWLKKNGSLGYRFTFGRNDQDQLLHTRVCALYATT